MPQRWPSAVAWRPPVLPPPRAASATVRTRRSQRPPVWRWSRALPDREFGDEVVGVAAIIGGSELDRLAAFEKRSPLDVERRAPRCHVEKLRLLCIEEHRVQPL